MKIGSLVECVEPFEEEDTFPITMPVMGEVYTIRAITHDPSDDFTGLHLEEIINPCYKYKEGRGEALFWSEKFREVQPPMSLSALMEECISNLQTA